MNDIKRAIEALKMENALMKFDPNTGEDYPIELQNQDNQDLYKANLIAISALEKQIPKKAKQYNDKSIFIYAGVFYCPSCQENVSMDDVYCCQCGQSLDWKAENE
jgi:hypothetical protein